MTIFNTYKTNIIGLLVIERYSANDFRGSLDKLYSRDTHADLFDCNNLRQINLSKTPEKGSIRGMHYQNSPYQETKLVSCIQGKIYDVAIDLRKNSATFLKFHGEILSESNKKSLLIPKGFAHGFQVLDPDTQLIYLHDAEYVPSFEQTINAFDQRIDINWPLEVTNMSQKDKTAAFLDTEFTGI